MNKYLALWNYVKNQSDFHIKMTFEQIEQNRNDNKKEWHKQLLRNNREKAIRKIKTELPSGVKLKEYLEILDAEIQQEN